MPMKLLQSVRSISRGRRNKKQDDVTWEESGFQISPSPCILNNQKKTRHKNRLRRSFSGAFSNKRVASSKKGNRDGTPQADWVTPRVVYHSDRYGDEWMNINTPTITTKGSTACSVHSKGTMISKRSQISKEQMARIVLTGLMAGPGRNRKLGSEQERIPQRHTGISELSESMSMEDEDESYFSDSQHGEHDDETYCSDWNYREHDTVRDSFFANSIDENASEDSEASVNYLFPFLFPCFVSSVARSPRVQQVSWDYSVGSESKFDRDTETSW